MALPQRPDDPSPEGSASGTPTRRVREPGQVDFELDFLAGILARDPLNADVLKVHADNLSARGFHEPALRADLQLVRLRGERPIPWYNLGCSYALLGLADKAFEALEKAIRLGYAPIGRIRRDPDLRSLRDDPRFARLLLIRRP